MYIEPRSVWFAIYCSDSLLYSRFFRAAVLFISITSRCYRVSSSESYTKVNFSLAGMFHLHEAKQVVFRDSRKFRSTYFHAQNEWSICLFLSQEFAYDGNYGSFYYFEWIIVSVKEILEGSKNSLTGKTDSTARRDYLSLSGSSFPLCIFKDRYCPQIIGQLRARIGQRSHTEPWHVRPYFKR